ncbi:MAG: hypothetical protein AB8F78_08915 [Saprospiraceae bacterium]
MIIKGLKSDGRWAFHPAFLLIPIVLGALWFYPSFLSSTPRTADRTVYCDAEEVSGGNFVTNGHTATNGVTQSSEKSFSGKYSSKLEGKHKYGMAITVPATDSKLRYIVSVRRWTSGPERSGLAVSGDPGDELALQTSIAIEKDDNGWELLQLEFSLPQDHEITEIKIFPYVFDDEIVAYFDDLRVETVDFDSLGTEPLSRLHFYLDNKAVEKLEAKRQSALQQGILKTADDDWVKAKLTIDDAATPEKIKLRLKGDWTDHLQGDYYSYRIQMPSDRSWNRLQTFSLQNPKTRFYLHEWLYHKALEHADIITPRYGFVLLSQNTKDQVLYAYEEHFDKQIAEFRDRREGVIVKFEEDYLWDQRIRNTLVHQSGFREAFATAEVLPFKGGRTTGSPKLMEQFTQANKLMNAFRFKSAPVPEVFDVDRLAKYFALADVFDANHGTIWHNLRFYYNPVTRKLEPIGFDGYTEVGPFKTYSDLFFGEYKSSESFDKWNAIYHYIFQDETFNRHYTAALLEYSSGNFINELQTKYREDLYGHERQINAFIDPDYQFDISDIRVRAGRIHNDIVPYPKTSLKVYRELDDNQKPTYWATSNHSLPLEVVGGSRKENGEVQLGEPSLIRSNRKWFPKSYTEVSIPEKSKFACFKLPGLDSTFYSEIYNWQRPGSELKILYPTVLEPKIPLAEGSYTNMDKTITIRSGKHLVTSPMVIPADYTLIVEAGAEIDFTKKSYLLSYGAFFCNGAKENPILFKSSDKSSQGVAVIQAKETSVLAYTSFNNLNTLEENEWQLTGAVTFYESDVNFNRVTVSHNLCEDALNLVRCKFDIKGLNINNTFADGFDGDFCKGTLSDSYLFKTGNDGLDFSGSSIAVVNVTLDEIGDKGISAGEQAFLQISDVTISKAQIGIASKDLSKVTVKNTTLKDCNQGFAAYRKKPEFGGGSIVVESYTAENVERISNVDSESTIKLPK